MDSTFRGLRELLPAEARTMSPRRLERLLESAHRGMTPIEAESFDQALRSIGNFARAALPVAAPLVASAIPGGALLGPLVSGVLSRGLAAPHASRVPPPMPSNPVSNPAGGAVSGSALRRLLTLIQTPAMLQSIAGPAAGFPGAGQVGQTAASSESMLNLLRSLAEQAIDEVSISAGAEAAANVEAWQLSPDPAERAEVLWRALQNDATFGAHLLEGDYDEGDYDEGDYDEGDYDEGDYDEGDYDEGDYDEGRQIPLVESVRGACDCF